MSDKAGQGEPVVYKRNGAIEIIELAKSERFNCLSMGMFRRSDEF